MILSIIRSIQPATEEVITLEWWICPPFPRTADGAHKNLNCGSEMAAVTSPLIHPDNRKSLFRCSLWIKSLQIILLSVWLENNNLGHKCMCRVTICEAAWGNLPKSWTWYLMLEMSCRCSSVVSMSGRTEANHSNFFSPAYCFSAPKSLSFTSGSSPRIWSTWLRSESWGLEGWVHLYLAWQSLINTKRSIDHTFTP